MDRKIKKALYENLAVPISTTSLALGTGEYAVRQGIKAGHIPHIRVGGKIMVPTAALRKLLHMDRSTS